MPGLAHCVGQKRLSLSRPEPVGLEVWAMWGITDNFGGYRPAGGRHDNSGGRKGERRGTQFLEPGSERTEFQIWDFRLHEPSGPVPLDSNRMQIITKSVAGTVAPRSQEKNCWSRAKKPGGAIRGRKNQTRYQNCLRAVPRSTLSDQSPSTAGGKVSKR